MNKKKGMAKAVPFLLVMLKISVLSRASTRAKAGLGHILTQGIVVNQEEEE